MVNGAYLGQSNMISATTIPDATYDGAALPAEVVEFRDLGAVVGVYTANFCSLVPALDQYLIAKGMVNARRSRRATNGADMVTMVYTHFPQLIADFQAMNRTPDYLVYWQMERESQDPASSPAADAERRLDHLLRLWWAYYPNCRVYLPYILHRDFVYGPQVLVIDAAQRSVVARYPGRIYGIETNTPSVLSKSDSVHADAAGHAECAARIDPFLP